MSGYISKVRELLAVNKKMTLPEIYNEAKNLERRQISSALCYLMKVGATTRRKIDNEGGVGRRNVYQYVYKLSNDVKRVRKGKNES